MRALRPITLVLLAVVALGRTPDAQSLPLLLFERYLDSLRQQADIPGLSAAIVHNRRRVWEGGFGFQDVENSVRAAPDTLYPIGGLSQTFAAVLVMQCVEQRALELDDPVRAWTSEIAEPGATIRHVLAHASGPVLGSFRYDPARYGALTSVIEKCGDQPYAQQVADDILGQVGMADSGHDVGAALQPRLAVPYKPDRNGKPARSDYPPRGINAATGLISTVLDLSRYDAALDDSILLQAGSLAATWNNTSFSGGATLPMGLGWFVQRYQGERVIWQFGLSPGAFSSLILKVPGRNATLILLANSDGLSSPFRLEDGDITRSVFATLFLRLFIDQ